MQIVETLNEGLKRAYTLTVTAKDIDARVDAEIKTIAPQVRMPGFRPGKVPANLVRKMHGLALQREALDKTVREGLDKIIADNKLRPAMQPQVDLSDDFEEGKDTKINIALEVLPQVPTPSIEGLKLERLVVDVTEEQLDEAVKRLAEQKPAFRRCAEESQGGLGRSGCHGLMPARSRACPSTAAPAKAWRW